MSIQEQIRALLRQHREGMSIKQMAAALGIRNQPIYVAINQMSDAWIDRWEHGGNRVGRPAAVWRVVPPHCPPPEKGRKS